MQSWKGGVVGGEEWMARGWIINVCFGSERVGVWVVYSFVCECGERVEMVCDGHKCTSIGIPGLILHPP